MAETENIPDLYDTDILLWSSNRRSCCGAAR